MKPISLVPCLLICLVSAAQASFDNLNCRAELENGSVKLLSFSKSESGLSEIIWADSYISSQLDGDNILSEERFANLNCEMNDLDDATTFVTCSDGSRLLVNIKGRTNLASVRVDSLAKNDIGFNFGPAECVAR